MREILFRGKRTDNHQWVEGFFIMDDLENPNPYIVNRWKHRVSHKTIGQYTGRTVNGKKLFEGDIVTGLFLFGMEIKAVVAFRDGAFGLQWNRGSVQEFSAFTSLCNVNYEIIGNIHDNPELLEESNES